MFVSHRIVIPANQQDLPTLAGTSPPRFTPALRRHAPFAQSFYFSTIHLDVPRPSPTDVNKEDPTIRPDKIPEYPSFLSSYPAKLPRIRGPHFNT